jgi:hypothetical protein
VTIGAEHCSSLLQMAVAKSVHACVALTEEHATITAHATTGTNQSNRFNQASE